MELEGCGLPDYIPLTSLSVFNSITMEQKQTSETGQLPPPAVVMVPQQPTVGGGAGTYQQQTATAGVLFVPVQSQQQQSAVFLPAVAAPSDLQPSHNLILTTVVTIACGLLNMTSLFIGIPAMYCAFVAYNSLKQQNYSSTKKMGYAAAVLCVVNIAYTGIVSTFIVGLVLRYYCGDREVQDPRYPGSYTTTNNCNND